MPQSPHERDQFELERLDSIKEYIDYLAGVYSREVPDHREDLAQESRIRVIKELRKNPDCPISHLKVAAKTAILHYRRRGKSIDSKINQTERPQSYSVTELNHTTAVRRSDHRFPLRITEEQALNQLLIDTLRGQLSPEENLVLTLRLEDISWKRIAAVFGNRYDCPVHIRRRLEEAAITALDQSAQTSPIIPESVPLPAANNGRQSIPAQRI